MSKLASILGMSILTSNPYPKFLIFGMDNDMKSTYKAKPKSQNSVDGSKPNKRRSKTKQARKQKHRR